MSLLLLRFAMICHYATIFCSLSPLPITAYAITMLMLIYVFARRWLRRVPRLTCHAGCAPQTRGAAANFDMFTPLAAIVFMPYAAMLRAAAVLLPIVYVLRFDA